MTTRTCRTPGCGRTAIKRRTKCGRCRWRIAMYGDPHYNPLLDVDEMDVAVIVRDRRPVEGLTRAERRQIARDLTARGVSAAEIARIVGVSDRSVCRWRAAERTPA